MLAVVAEHDADDAAAVGEPVACDVNDFTLDRLDAAFGQTPEWAHVGQVFVGAREVKEQVADGSDAQPRELFHP
jgi:hypothetical protein